MALRRMALASCALLSLQCPNDPPAPVSPTSPVTATSATAPGSGPPPPAAAGPWDPYAVDLTRGKYCEDPRVKKVTPIPGIQSSHPRSRFARYALDSGCEHHGQMLCSNGAHESARAKACVELELFAGGAPKAIAESDSFVCAQCDEKPANGLPARGRACNAGDLQRANDKKPIMNMPGELADELTKMFGEAMATRATNAPDSDKVWKEQLLTLVRVLAPAFGYCEDSPFGAWGSADWPYAPHRMDLNQVFVWADATTPSDIKTSPAFFIKELSGDFHVGLGAFVNSFGSLTFDLDELGLAFFHEMRHMGTDHYGGGSITWSSNDTTQGMINANKRVRDAEHMLNELEDYKVMFEHPWAYTMEAGELARAHQDFHVGEEQERSCFAWQWMANEKGDGNPPDGKSSPGGLAAPLPMGLLGGPLMFGPGGPRPPLAPPRPAAGIPGSGAPFAALPGIPANPAACGGSSEPLAANDEERCAVALWANGNGWMQAQMIRSLRPDTFVDWQGQPRPLDAEPWNVVGRWALGIPIAMFPYCYRDASGVHMNKR
jgi:hypothetical protein